MMILEDLFHFGCRSVWAATRRDETGRVHARDPTRKCKSGFFLAMIVIESMIADT